MTDAFSARELGRWLLAAAGVVVAYFATLYVGLRVLFYGPFPKELAEPTVGFLMGLFVVLAGSLLAPRQRLVTALVLLVAGTALAKFSFSFHLLGTVAGGVVAVALVAWWFHPRRTPRSVRWVGIGASVVLFVLFGVGYALYVDIAARPEALPPHLVQVLGSDPLLVTAFYRYDLGGFLDHEWLWRIDAKPEVVALIVGRLGLRRTHAVPRDFWRMPPHYWPRSMTTSGEAFQSPRFSARRGPDGEHYFLVHDKTQGRAFVWFKDNF